MQQAAYEGGLREVEQDILQLRGLTDLMNTAEFLPLREEEITDVNLPRRLLNYGVLIDEVVERLVADGLADTQKSRRFEGDYTRAGRGVRLHSRFGSWFGIDIGVRSQCGITPLWWEINTNRPFSGITAGASKVQNLLEEAVDSQYGDGWVCIPIRLKTGVERDRVIDAIVEQIRSIGDGLNRAFPAAAS